MDVAVVFSYDESGLRELSPGTLVSRTTEEPLFASLPIYILSQNAESRSGSPQYFNSAPWASGIYQGWGGWVDKWWEWIRPLLAPLFKSIQEPAVILEFQVQMLGIVDITGRQAVLNIHAVVKGWFHKKLSS